jgi:hypothetical protein
LEYFSFFTFFPPQFCKNIWFDKKVCKTIHMIPWGRR